MEDKSLGNYRSDISNLPEDIEEISKSEPISGEKIQASMYHQEINTLKIEKLAQRITIISVIIPCIIIAVLAFAYIDMKERMVDVDETQDSHLAQIAGALEQKLNALDVRIAKTTFDLDEKLALIEKKSLALENQAAKMSSTKADLTAMNKAMSKLEKQIKTNAGKYKSTLAKMEQINGQLQAAIKKNNAQFKSQAGQIKDEIGLFKEEFDARLLELSAYEQQIAHLTKNTGLLDKQIKTLKQDTDLSTDRKLAQQQTAFEKKIGDLKALIKAGAVSQAPKPVVLVSPAPKTVETVKPVSPPPSKPVVSPQTGTGISEQTLTQ